MVRIESSALHPPFAVTVDLVVLTIRDGELHALLVRRGERAVRGPLGAARRFRAARRGPAGRRRRELREETGLAPTASTSNSSRTYGAPRRDPRMRVVTVAYLALLPDLPDPGPARRGRRRGGGRSTRCCAAARLAFDHAPILADGVERARAKLEYTPLAAAFCPPEFTVAELRRVYEAVWGTALDPRNFHRKVTRTQGFLGRPADDARRRPAGPALPAR